MFYIYSFKLLIHQIDIWTSFVSFDFRQQSWCVAAVSYLYVSMHDIIITLGLWMNSWKCTHCGFSHRAHGSVVACFGAVHIFIPTSLIFFFHFLYLFDFIFLYSFNHILIKAFFVRVNRSVPKSIRIAIISTLYIFHHKVTFLFHFVQMLEVFNFHQMSVFADLYLRKLICFIYFFEMLLHIFGRFYRWFWILSKICQFA